MNWIIWIVAIIIVAVIVKMVVSKKKCGCDGAKVCPTHSSTDAGAAQNPSQASSSNGQGTPSQTM